MGFERMYQVEIRREAALRTAAALQAYSRELQEHCALLHQRVNAMLRAIQQSREAESLGKEIFTPPIRPGFRVGKSPQSDESKFPPLNEHEGSFIASQGSVLALYLLNARPKRFGSQLRGVGSRSGQPRIAWVGVGT
jgi:hypothetical protein